MASKLTITAKTGPAKSTSSLVINNLVSLHLDAVNQVVSVVSSDNPGQVREFDISAQTTFTVTISSGSYTCVIS